MDGAGQGYAVALAGPFVGTFLPSRAAKLPLAMIRSLGCLCAHCLEATFPSFCMHVDPCTQDFNQVPVNWNGLGCSAFQDVWILILLSIQCVWSPSELHVACAFDLMLPLLFQSSVMMLRRKEDAPLYGQAI